MVAAWTHSSTIAYEKVQRLNTSPFSKLENIINNLLLLLSCTIHPINQAQNLSFIFGSPSFPSLLTFSLSLIHIVAPNAIFQKPAPSFLFPLLTLWFVFRLCPPFITATFFSLPLKFSVQFSHLCIQHYNQSHSPLFLFTPCDQMLSSNSYTGFSCSPALSTNSVSLFLLWLRLKAEPHDIHLLKLAMFLKSVYQTYQPLSLTACTFKVHTHTPRKLKNVI